MSTYDARLATLEKGVEVMREDIIYKLDENNSAITILKGVAQDQGQDIKDMKVRLNGFERRLDAVERHLDSIDQRFVSMEEKFDKRFEQVDKRFEQVDKRFEQVDKRFEQINVHLNQMAQMLKFLVSKAE